MNRSTHIGTSLRTNVLGSLLLLALSGLLFSSSAMAGRKPPPPPPPPPGPVTLNDVVASFDGTHINSGLVPAGHDCSPLGEATTVSGTLACDPGPPTIQINTFGIGSLTTGKKTLGICKSFSAINGVGFLGNPNNFTVTYTGDCNSAQGCTVAMAMTLTGNIAALTGGVADHANITFAGLVQNAGSSNPFAAERNVAIDQLVLNFLKPTGALAASCFWGVTSAGPQVFMTQPVVP